MTKYEIWIREIDRNRAQVQKGEPFLTTLRYCDDMTWRKVEALVRAEPFEGGEPSAILGDGSGVYDKGKWFIKVLRELPEDEMIFHRVGGAD